MFKEGKGDVHEGEFSRNNNFEQNSEAEEKFNKLFEDDYFEYVEAEEDLLSLDLEDLSGQELYDKLGWSEEDVERIKDFNGKENQDGTYTDYELDFDSFDDWVKYEYKVEVTIIKGHINTAKEMGEYLDFDECMRNRPVKFFYAIEDTILENRLCEKYGIDESRWYELQTEYYDEIDAEMKYEIEMEKLKELEKEAVEYEEDHHLSDLYEDWAIEGMEREGLSPEEYCNVHQYNWEDIERWPDDTSYDDDEFDRTDDKEDDWEDEQEDDWNDDWEDEQEDNL